MDKPHHTFYGECRLKELLGGYFVIIHEGFHNEFEEFRGTCKVKSMIGPTHTLVKGIKLLKV